MRRVPGQADRAHQAGSGSPRAQRGGGDRGVALVEFALVAPLLFALLLGTITGGVALSRKNSMSNAVREGARLGATLPAEAGWEDDVQDRVDELSTDLSPSQICVSLEQGDGGVVFATTCGPDLVGGEPSTPASLGADECVVKVWASRQSELNAIFFRRDLTLDVSAVARFERGGGSSGCA